MVQSPLSVLVRLSPTSLSARRWLGLGLGFIISAGVSPAQSITYQRAAASAQVVLRDLSPKVGVNLLTSPQTEKEILCLNLKDAPAKEVLNQIAWAVSGSWKREGTDLRLIRSASDVADEKLRSRRRAIQNFANMIADQRLDLGKMAPFTPERATVIARKLQAISKSYNPTKGSSANAELIGAEAPFERMVSKIATTLTPADYADLPDKAKVVFSSDPTQMQRALPREIIPILEEFRRNQAIWAEVTERIPVEQPEFNGARYNLKGMTYSSPPPEKWGKVLLTVTRQPLFTGASLNLVIADPAGTKLAEGYASLSPSQFRRFGNKLPTPSETDPEVKVNRYAEALAKAMSSGSVDTLPADLRSRLVNPEGSDPLALTFGELMVNYADAKKISLVVDMDDVTFLFGANPLPKIPASLFDTVIDAMFESNVGEGCTAIRPTDPAATRENRIDRRLLGQYVRRIFEVKEMTIEESAQWLARFPEQDDQSMLTALIRIMTGQALYSSDPKWLRLYGSLTASQKKAGLGDGLYLGDLSPQQAEIVNGMVYGDRTYLSFTTRPGQHSIYGTIYQEPTEALPNGLPARGKIKLMDRSEDAIFGAGGTGSDRGYSPVEFAWQVHASRHPEKYPWMKDQPAVNLASLKVGRRVTLQISMELTDQISLNTNLVEPHVLGAKQYTFDTLPDSIKAKINEALKSYDSMPDTPVRTEGTPTPVQP